MKNEIELDETLDVETVETTENSASKRTKKRETDKMKTNAEEDELVNCLRHERVIVRHIPQQKGKFPKGHVFEGGLSENATRTYVVPKLESGIYVNVLTDDEKRYLENIMGLEYNAMSVYKRENNFWSDANETGMSVVTLHKQDNYLDLSIPSDYIKYKILLANKDKIASSLTELNERPKATYEFVIIAENEETSIASEMMSNTMKCYKEYGKIENDMDKLRFIILTLEGKTMSKDSKLESLQVKINELIQLNPKRFLTAITDKLLDTKLLVMKATEEGIIVRRNNLYFMRNDNSPLCGNNEESTLPVAARFLTMPKNQDLLFSIQDKLNNR